jgi:hypothetical protein
MLPPLGLLTFFFGSSRPSFSRIARTRTHRRPARDSIYRIALPEPVALHVDTSQ